ncbi:branched-chain amino acid ABC transporter permease [Stetteria hydrogenophila]
MAILPGFTFTLSSIAYAAAIGLLSMGLTLTYQTTRVPNFAHATIAMIGSVATLLVIDRILGAQPSWKVFILGPLLGGVAAAAFSVLMYLAVLKPLAARGNTITGLMIATFAVDIILLNLLTLILYETPGRHIPKLIGAPVVGYQPKLKILGHVVDSYTVVLPVTAVILTALFHLFLTRTSFGVAMRATIENPSLAGAMGVNTDLVYTVSWAISGFLAGVAGALMAFSFKGVDPAVSALVIVTVFAGSIVGGLESVYWGLIGGFLVGLAEKIGTAIVNNVYRAVFVTHLGFPNVSLINYEKVMSLSLVILVLLYAPRGLAGVDWSRLAARLGLKRLPSWRR